MSPVKSKRQFRFVQSLKSRYKNKNNTPKKYQWIWAGGKENNEWTPKGIYQDLPEGTVKDYRGIIEMNLNITAGPTGSSVQPIAAASRLERDKKRKDAVPEVRGKFAQALSKAQQDLQAGEAPVEEAGDNKDDTGVECKKESRKRYVSIFD